MATEILRPMYSSTTWVSSSSRPDYVPSEPSLYATELWTLINETDPDDDASYIAVLAGEKFNPFQVFSIMFNSSTLRSGYTAIKKITAYLRVKSSDTNVTEGQVCITSLLYSVTNENDWGCEPRASRAMDLFPLYGASFSCSSSWTTVAVPLNVESTIEEIEQSKTVWEQFSYVPVMGMAIAGVDSSGSNKSKTMSLTQAWLEIEYDDPDSPDTPTTTETIYLKQGGSWTSVPCTIYQKQNGAWVLTDSTVFENGDKYQLHT